MHLPCLIRHSTDCEFSLGKFQLQIYTFKMATQNVFNQIYDEVRKTGLPYQIKESGGSLIIRISSDSRQQFNQNKEKFKFSTSRTFNGSNNVNWRSPKTFEENSCSRPSFPDITLFRSTPPTTAPPPTQRTTASSPSTSDAATAVSATQHPQKTYRGPHTATGH
jgi:hypothetical protein